ncbi:MAG: hypothetical protein IPP15_00435 [Saprospiraceae bacterium]|uniref:Uncharacterized protein n=1 Tax=Candidatus Opimibacter skivensis TaxID=2982028 RepID=A0A9D7SRY4_9BACT|nr:hypothetical protein [Candidatus Opimibacter skivensis]
MKAVLTLYTKLFLFTGILFGLLMLLSYLLVGEGFDFKHVILRAAYFGVFMSFVLGTFHIGRIVMKGAGKLTSDNLSVRHKEQIQSGLDFQKLLNAIKTDPVLNKMEIQQGENMVTLKSGLNWFSWGERILINVKAAHNSLTTYEISSEPVLKTTLVDYGKNLENINRIEKILNTRS